MKQQNNRDSLIICFTYYHLLISIIKVLHSKKPVDLIIEDFTTESGSIVLNDMDLIKRIEKSGLFRSVLVCNYRGIFSDDVSLWKKELEECFILKGVKGRMIIILNHTKKYLFLVHRCFKVFLMRRKFIIIL